MNFSLPKNIKQIGSLDKNLKIYIEDYAFTFIQQFSKEDNDEDKIAILVGQDCNIDGNDVIFISGVIKPKYTEINQSMVVLTDKSFDYIQQQIETYFSDLKVVGWFYSRLGFEKTISQSYIDYHKQNFFSENKVLFLNDPNENYGAFFKFDHKKDKFKELRGFIIYYERNEGMSEYMLNNKTYYNSELIEKKEKEVRLKIEEEKTKDFDLENEFSNEEQKTKLTEPKRPKVFTKSDINLKQVKKINEDVKKTNNIFGTLTAVLLLVCFVMGAGLIQNEDRITELESRLTKVDEAYKYLLLQVTNDSVQSVFAETVQNIPNENTQTNQVNENVSTQTTVNENNTEQKEFIENSDTSEQTSEDTQEIEIITYDTSYDKLQQSQQVSKDTTQEISNETYVIKDGDSLEKISREFYGTRDRINEIMEINNIEDPNKIYSGMKIKLP